MDDLTINGRSFHSAIEELGSTIKNRSNSMSALPTFKEKTLYVFPRHVSGEEMNDFVSVLQGNLAGTNQFLVAALKEVQGIYVALDKLDKDYINGIIQSLNTAKKAIDKAEESLDKANTSLSQVKKNSEQNTKTLQALQVTISQLSTFQRKVDDALPLIPEHSKALDEASRGLKQVSASIAMLKKRFPQFQSQTQEAINQAGNVLAENLLKKIAAANTDTEKRLVAGISEARTAAETKAAEQLDEAEKRLAACISEARTAAENTASELLSEVGKSVNKKILQIQQNVQESIEENSEVTRGQIERTDHSLRCRIVLSYIIGGVGIICSVVTLILSLLHVI